VVVTDVDGSPSLILGRATIDPFRDDEEDALREIEMEESPAASWLK
jgi:hypothetical protein